MAAADRQFVDGMRALGTYRDATICHTQTTGGGHRFHGFRVFKFNRARKLLHDHQKNATFKFKNTGVIEIEVRPMANHNTCTGVVDPATLTFEPYLLQARGKPVPAGAVTRTDYTFGPAVTDSLLHRLCEHPYVLDAWLQDGKLSVFVTHDRNILGGLVQELKKRGKTPRCRPPMRNGALLDSWTSRTRPGKKAQRRRRNTGTPSAPKPGGGSAQVLSPPCTPPRRT